MKFRRVRLQDGTATLAVHDGDGKRWLPIAPAAEALGLLPEGTRSRAPRVSTRAAVADTPLGAQSAATDLAAPVGDFSALLASEDLVAILDGGEALRARLRELCEQARERAIEIACEPAPLLPYQPPLLRAFATSERHWLQSARGHLRRNMPALLPLVGAYERITRRPFPPFRPGRLFYEQPSYYIGNALTFVPDGAEAPWPAYTRALDFELELGAILCRPLRDASIEQAREAIGGFVVINDLSARDTQWQEVRHGVFGPLAKTKSFASTLGAVVVSADEVIDRVRALSASVRVNGRLWSATDTSDQRWSFEQMIAFASCGEQLAAGELFSSGTLHDGCSLEIGRWLAPGDLLELEIEGVGTLTNRIGAPH